MASNAVTSLSAWTIRLSGGTDYNRVTNNAILAGHCASALVRAFDAEVDDIEQRRLCGTVGENTQGIARHGAKMVTAVSSALGRDDIEGFHQVRDSWAGAGGDLSIETLAEDGARLDFNVTRCRFAELYRQHATGTGARLTDPYVVEAKDAIPESDILGGLTPGVTRLTNRDLATMMIAVSDNGATNLLIDRVGMEKVNAMLDGLGLRGYVDTDTGRYVEAAQAVSAWSIDLAADHYGLSRDSDADGNHLVMAAVFEV